MKRIKTKGKNEGRLEKYVLEVTSPESAFSENAFDNESANDPVSEVTGKNTLLTVS